MISAQAWEDAQLIWDYHQMHHTPKPCSVAIGLGSHDLSVATAASKAYEAGLATLIVFTGANSPTTRDRFPDGEATAYREHALKLGVPNSAILIEPHATNTGQNITYSRELLESTGIDISSVLLISKPYEQRRAYATACKLWPSVEFVCLSASMEFTEYVDSLGDAQLVIDMLVGALQRLMIYPQKGFMIKQEVPGDILEAYERLRRDGFTSRLMPTDAPD
ncbi:YdcF family protein [Streptomyces albipurpureus]|uniref:YdcF family protein n=1 Tax=Streptomyces albipurpureus TaxID=2897419 RepID=A0ABT0UVA4_9ACTN|nr:YdcF family protein [Streptomyces sp. CWNU-1]MCM2392512.1 YdcF family protein [Streptomyces sp. CWNU-1]